MKNGQTRAAAIRETKRREILESLKQRGLVQQVVETADKLADLDKPLDSGDVQRLKAANDARLALIKKYLPDLKQAEIDLSERGLGTTKNLEDEELEAIINGGIDED